MQRTRRQALRHNRRQRNAHQHHAELERHHPGHTMDCPLRHTIHRPQRNSHHLDTVGNAVQPRHTHTILLPRLQRQQRQQRLLRHPPQPLPHPLRRNAASLHRLQQPHLLLRQRHLRHLHQPPAKQRHHRLRQPEPDLAPHRPLRHLRARQPHRQPAANRPRGLLLLH